MELIIRFVRLNVKSCTNFHKAHVIFTDLISLGVTSYVILGISLQVP